MLSVCPACGGAIVRGRHTFDVHVGRRTVSVAGEYLRCEGECREFYFAPGEMDAAMITASETVRREEGLLTPADIRSFRKRVGLTQPQLENLLGAGPKTVTRWEKGTVIQNGATDTLLRVMRDVPEALSYLLRQRGPDDIRGERMPFGEAYERFLATHALSEVGLDEAQLGVTRDKAAGRKVAL